MSTPSRRLIISRDASLHAATIDGRGIHLQQRLINLETLTSKDDTPLLWTVSPDGRQIAYTQPYPKTLPPVQNWLMPQTVYVAGLPGATNKRLLFTTPYLRDARGRRVTEYSDFTRLPHQKQGYPLPDTNIGGEWPISSLLWSRSGDRLYVSFDYVGNTIRGHITCAVDARTGDALTNAAGKWQQVLPTCDLDESANGRLIGIGQGRTRDEPEVCNACSRYFPVYKVHGGGPPVSLLPGTFTSLKKPPYAFADGCAISPDGSRVTITCKNVLWLTSPDTLRYTRLLTLPKTGTFGGITWLSDDTLLCGQYSEAHNNRDGLWQLSLTSAGKLAPSPHLLLRGDVGFDTFVNT